MEGGQFGVALAAEAGHKLEEAAGVGGDDGRGVGVEEVGGLAIAEFVGRFGMEEVVDAGGTAAHGRLGDLGDLEARDRGEEGAGFEEDALGVPEVAGVVVGDAEREGVAGGKGRKLSEELGDVATAGGKGAGALGPVGVVAEEMAVVLHGGAAAGGVDEDRVDLGLFEEGDDGLGHGGRFGVEAGVEHEGSAAGLAGRDDDLAAFGGEDAGGRLVDVGEEDGLDAAGEHAYAAAGGWIRGGFEMRVSPLRR